jgi:hypothetical protein
VVSLLTYRNASPLLKALTFQQLFLTSFELAYQIPEEFSLQSLESNFSLPFLTVFSQ